MNSARYNLIPKPGLEINSLEGWLTHFPMRLSSTMGFIFWSSILVGIPIHNLKTPKTKLELVSLGTK